MLLTLFSPQGASLVAGGWSFPATRGEKKERVRAERERLGIIPKKVAAVIRQVALVAEPGDGLVELLVAALEREELAYRAIYAQILREQVELRREEEAIVFLLLMH